jgi:transglutaminase-like putative cysteine protease
LGPPARVDQVLWLTAGLAMAAAPHAGRVPVWTTAFCAALALWRLGGLAGRVALPGRTVRALLALAFTVGVFASHGGILGRDPGVTMLVGFAGLKLLETRSRRDAFVATLAGTFLAIASVLFTQAIPVGLYLLATLVVLTASLVALAVPGEALPPRRQLTLAATLLAQASPVALALFVLFPRLPGPLWSLPADAHAGTSGLSDTMNPGYLSQLGLSDAVAFRVKPDGALPPGAELYWRGPVLWATDGRNWSAGDAGSAPPPPLEATGPAIGYTVTLEPHGRRWLFALDLPTEVPAGATLRGDYQVLAARPVRSRTQYRAASATRYRLGGLDPEQRRAALALPSGSHAGAVALARGWAAQGLAPEGLVSRALAHFRDEPFVYTLAPPLMLGDPVDEFLFGARRGFCEHFAAAFTVLMRAAGVPARVVTGYQGGEINPIDGYLVVRQRDAHAWTEVWIEDRGWVRVDPTAAVSPTRVEGGLAAALPGALSRFGGLVLDEDSGVVRLLLNVRHSWDAVNNWWNRWVLGFEAERQRQVLRRIGVDPADWRRMGTALLLLVGGPVLVVGWVLHRGRRPRPDPARRLYDRFSRRLARVGLARGPAEAPLAYARRAGGRLPEAAAGIDAVTEAYTLARYGARGADLARLRALVRGFRPAGKTQGGLFG